MKTTTKHNALKLIAAIVMTAAASSAYATISTTSKSECYFVSQLKDPVTRMEFVTKLQLAKQSPDLLTGIPSRDGEQFLVQIMDESGRPAEVDQFSFDCMSCHDGLSAASHSSRVKSVSADGSVNVRGSHPIGMDYGSAAAGKPSFKSAENLIFVAGRVGCLSCHNPLNPERYHLAADNHGSNLCFTCHNT